MNKQLGMCKSNKNVQHGNNPINFVILNQTRLPQNFGMDHYVMFFLIYKQYITTFADFQDGQANHYSWQKTPHEIEP
jgi:hypothetical protein